MKKIRVVFAVSALALASIGVFASNAFQIEYYRSQVSGTVIPDAADCFQKITAPVCGTGTVQCRQTVSGLTGLYRISVKASPTAPCQILPGKVGL